MVLSKVEKPAIEAVLAEASAAKLKELAKNYYVKGYSKMNKPALVQAVSAALREPGRNFPASSSRIFLNPLIPSLLKILK